MNGAAVCAVLTSTSYLVASFAIARRIYRREYNLIYGSPAPSTYGGKNGHGVAAKYARREAYEWLAMWPFYLCWSMIGVVWDLIDGLITSGIRQGWVERDNALSRLQDEIDRLQTEQDPLQELDKTPIEDLPSKIDFSNPGDPWLWKDEGADRVIVTAHPEIIVTRRPDLIAQHMRCGNIREYEVGTVASPERKMFIDDQGHCWEDE